MGHRKNSQKSVKFIDTNCKYTFQLQITITCILILEAATWKCSAKKCSLKISQTPMPESRFHLFYLLLFLKFPLEHDFEHE